MDTHQNPFFSQQNLFGTSNYVLPKIKVQFPSKIRFFLRKKWSACYLILLLIGPSMATHSISHHPGYFSETITQTQNTSNWFGFSKWTEKMFICALLENSERHATSPALRLMKTFAKDRPENRIFITDGLLTCSWRSSHAETLSWGKRTSRTPPLLCFLRIWLFGCR